MAGSAESKQRLAPLTLNKSLCKISDNKTILILVIFFSGCAMSSQLALQFYQHIPIIVPAATSWKSAEKVNIPIIYNKYNLLVKINCSHRCTPPHTHTSHNENVDRYKSQTMKLRAKYECAYIFSNCNRVDTHWWSATVDICALVPAWQMPSCSSRDLYNQWCRSPCWNLGGLWWSYHSKSQNVTICCLLNLSA